MSQTEREQGAESPLKRAHGAFEASLLASIVESSDDAIVSKTLDGIVTSWNVSAERIFGYTAAEMIGQSILRLIPPDLADEERQIIRKLRDGERIHHYETVRVAKDGTRVDVSLSVSPLFDDSGRIIGAAKVARDISDRNRSAMALRESEERLRQSQKLEAIGQLTGSIAHDFNNFLNVILGNADSLVEGLSKDVRLRALAEMTVVAAEKAAQLTKRLLAFARRQPLEPRVVNVDRLIRDLDTLLRRSLGEDIETEMVRAGGLWSALVDPTELETAILNLAINARDAMPGGGRLTIETANTRLDEDYAALHPEVSPGQYVMVSLTDSGTGMTDDQLVRAFEPFYTTKEIGKGTGLGLSMVYGFVKQSRGHIKLYSEVGVGTTVKVYLPRAEAQSEAASDRYYQGASPGGIERILLVEDNDLVREQAQESLTSLGYAVVPARHGAEALDILKRDTDFDLLFTDIVMPGGLNGRQLADEIRKTLPDLPVLFASGYTENAIVHNGRLDKNVHLLSKPYRKKQLAEKLRVVLGKPHQR